MSTKTQKQGTLEKMAAKISGPSKKRGDSTARKPAESTRSNAVPRCEECGGPMEIYRTEKHSDAYPSFMAKQGHPAAITKVQRRKCAKCGRTAKTTIRGESTPKKI